MGSFSTPRALSAPFFSLKEKYAKISDLKNPKFDESKSIYLEFYRGIAALGVAISHYLSAKGMGNAEFAAIIFVEMFFPLSGFILAPQVLRVEKNRKSLPIFLVRRWMRTIPLYLLGLFLMAVVTLNLSSPQFKEYLFFYYFLLPGYGENNFYPISWSLAAEEYYYIIAPLFMIALPRFSVKQKICFFLIGAFIFKVILAFYTDHQFLRISTLSRVDSIGIGFLLFLLIDKVRMSHAVALGLAFAGCAYLHQIQHSPASALAFMYTGNFFFGVVCALMYRHERTLPIRGLVFRAVASLIGSASYAIYVLHLLVLTIAVKADIPLLGYVTLTLLLSHFVHVYLEQPLMKMRPKYRS